MIQGSRSSRPLRILYVALDVDRGKSTGEATHVFHVVRSLADLGHDLTVVLPDTQANVHELARLATVNVRPIFVPVGSTVRHVRRLVALTRHQAFDAIYERRFNPKVAAALQFLRGIPFVVEVNSITPVDAELYHRSRNRYPRLSRRWHSFFLRRASAIVVVTEGLASELRFGYGLVMKRIEVLPNGVDPRLFRPMDLQTARGQLNLPQSILLACFVGDLAPWYALETVLEAVARLRDEGFPVGLLLVGDGVRQDELRALSTDLKLDGLVRWIGRVSHEEVPIYIAASDVALAPIAPIERKVRSGSSALKIFEYLACARPVITTDVFAQSQPDLAGALVLIPPGDSAALAHALRRLLEDRRESRRLGEEGRRLVAERYSWTAVAERLSGILMSIATKDQG